MKVHEPQLPPPGVRQADVLALHGGVAREARDWIAEECAVALVFNGISHAVMMATPADLEDFATGFALTEGLIEDLSELRGIEVAAAAAGIEVQIDVSPACEWRLRERRRTLAGRTGCGLCGVDSLAGVRLPIAPLAPLDVAAAAVAQAQRSLHEWQAMQQLTGATHAAAWCDLAGTPRVVREDVGRHNALDKVIGAMRRNNTDVRGGFACITSRASFEMAQKSARAGIAALAAVSAPTALAVDVARGCGQLLLGFVRGDDLVAYTFPERLRLADGAAARPQPPSG